MQDNPHTTIAELAENLNLSTRAIEKQIAKLQELDRIRRVGSDKGGRWEVLK
jgi:ATP-dependent DNA helicase RecG